MKRALAVAVVLGVIAPAAAAWAQADDEEEDEDEEEEEDDDEGEGAEDFLPPKQNLTGHAAEGKTPTEFERDRFFVDKVDTEKTLDKTLIQGSISSSSFLYQESGGGYVGLDGMTPLTGSSNAGPRRVFTELRLQSDFRHIKGSRWDARIDARARVVNAPPNGTYTTEAEPTTILQSEPNRIQSGLFGENEYDVRELWLIRSGKRSDVFIGRQFVPDLGGFKFDGIRVDYAKSRKLTLIGFGGLLPVRGSRSVTTDYLELKDTAGNSAGRLVGTGGFGAAYRTINGYGALGGAAQVPFKGEQPRIYVTSNGYWRNGAKLDVYHYVLIDLLGSAAQESTGRIQLTNLSTGLNYKPTPRLRLTAAYHRVDTETLGVHAGAFLNTPDVTGNGSTIVQNETYIQRIATNAVRGGISAGLGKQQRFEISTAVSLRHRPAFELRTPDNTLIGLDAAKSVEVWGSLVDRRSIKNTRIGLEASRTFKVGTVAYQRSEALLTRLFVLRELAGGRGEWEAEASFSDIRGTPAPGSMTSLCLPGVYADCYGVSTNRLYSIGGQVFYRLRRDWFGIGTLHLMRITNTRGGDMPIVDPAVLAVTGFVRIAKRF